MKRHWAVTLAALVALPCIAQAQGNPSWGPVLRVTPYIGVSPGFMQKGEATVFTDSNVSLHEYHFEFGSTLPVGVNVEYRFWNRFSAVAGGVWSSRGADRLLDFEDEVVYTPEGSNFWMAKAGLALRLQEPNADMQLRRLNASIFVAPAFIHDAAKKSVFTPQAATASINEWGVNLGADAELPLANNRLAFSAGVEDWLVFWDNDKYRNRIEPYIQTHSPDAVVAVEAMKSHMLILRFGLTWRY